MRNIQQLFKIALLIVAMNSMAASQTDTKSTLDQDKREAREVAAIFLRRMTATRDVRSLKDLFLAGYVKRRVEAQRDWLSRLSQDAPFVLIESIPVWLETDLLPVISDHDWERFYIAKFNLRYLWLLTLASKFNASELDKQSNVSEMDIYPPVVSALLRSNRFLAGDHTGEVPGDGRHMVSTLKEFLDLVATLEQASTILRNDFLKNPPEETRLYKENLRLAPEGEGGRRQNDLAGVAVSELDSPKEIRFRLLTKPEFFELSLVKTDSGVKIVWVEVYPYN